VLSRATITTSVFLVNVGFVCYAAYVVLFQVNPVFARHPLFHGSRSFVKRVLGWLYDLCPAVKGQVRHIRSRKSNLCTHYATQLRPPEDLAPPMWTAEHDEMSKDQRDFVDVRSMSRLEQKM
jgi:hypothetical protein